jgi:hypothetical protein
VTRARTTDPETSHEAAESLGDLPTAQAHVLWVLARYGPMTDAELIGAYRPCARAGVVGYQSDSGIRTRRAELVKRGDVIDTGKRQMLPSGRRAIVWKLA